MRAYVLAGGASSRMGADKARLPHDGMPAAVWLATQLAAAGLMPTVVRRGAPDGLPWRFADGTSVRVLREPDSASHHPLNGVVAAFEDASGADIVVVPCDTVALSVDTLRRLARAPAVAMGDADAGLHPLVAHLPDALADRARELRDAGGSARRLVADLPHVLVPDAELVDRNEGGGPWPVETLRARLHFVDDAAFARIASSERVRQRATGLVDPSANRYALRPEPGRPG